MEISKTNSSQTSKATQTEFNFDKLISTIENLNNLTDKLTSNPNEDEKEKSKLEEQIKNSTLYINNYINHLTTNKKEDKIKILESILALSNDFWRTNGEDLTESLWKLYDTKYFHIFSAEMTLPYYDYFLHLFFLNHKNLDTLLKHGLFNINKETRKIESNFTLEKYNTIKHEFSISSSSEDPALQTHHKNFLIDLILLLTMTQCDIRGFYTSLSAFIVSSDNNVMLLFKVISLFSLCIWGFDKKENFISGLLYIVGGVLRDFGKSYLKTKGILDQNLSYHKCPKNKHHETGFFAPQTLTTKECDYLELYFLPIMREFIKTIISGVVVDIENKGENWDDYLGLFYKLLEMESLDQEDSFPPSVEIYHFLNLFLSDFLFFFLSNFCKFDKEKGFSSIFSYFDEFIGYALSVVSKGCRNVNNLFEFSEKKRKFFEFECEKSEYMMKDTFNHYGLCLIFFLFLTGEYDPVNVLNEKDFVMESSFLPLVIDKKYYFDIYQSALLMVVNTENTSEFKFFKVYQQFSFVFLKEILKTLANGVISTKGTEKENKLVVNILFEFSKFEESNMQFSVLREYLAQFDSVR